jgi:uncharacterized protein (TIGR02757 family)
LRWPLQTDIYIVNGTKKKLERLYSIYNHRQYVHPDPIAFLYDYDNPDDREVVAFVASALAYGRVTQIMNSVNQVLREMGPAPKRYLARTSWDTLRTTFHGFRHRFATGDQVAAMLTGVARVLARYGTLQTVFRDGYREGDDTVLPALAHFVGSVIEAAPAAPGHLLPHPGRGSACKRLNLFLRWMVRADAVDPGGWEGISPAQLIVPLDTHMLRLGLQWGFTRRKQGSMQTALEITAGFRAVNPRDPVRYDFILTRLGIWGKIALLEE